MTMTMAITSVLFFMVTRELWGWTRVHAGVVSGGFLIVDLAFLGPNLLKVHTGGWFPLVAAGVVFTLMTTWRTGRRLTRARLEENATPLADLIRVLDAGEIPRIPGTAVFPTGNPGAVPTALEQHLRHMRVLHERVVLLTVRTRDVAHVDATVRVTVQSLGAGVYAVISEQGFMEESDVPAILAACAPKGRPGAAGEVCRPARAGRASVRSQISDRVERAKWRPARAGRASVRSQIASSVQAARSRRTLAKAVLRPLTTPSPLSALTGVEAVKSRVATARPLRSSRICA